MKTNTDHDDGRGTSELSNPVALAVAAYAVYSVWHGPWEAFSLVCLCGICVSLARLLQPAVADLLYRLHVRQLPAVVANGPGHVRAIRAAVTLGALLVVQLAVSPKTWQVLLDCGWPLLVFPPLLLALVFEYLGTAPAELSEALAKSKIGHAHGLAWTYFIGYLMILFGYGHGTQGEASVPSFEQRMADYLSSQHVDEQGRKNTLKRKMIILVPMKHEALLSDRDLGCNDKSVTMEAKLPGITDERGRLYGEMQVYLIKNAGCHYRVVMEEATPVRTAALAAEDTNVEDFNVADFKEFPHRFLAVLRICLRSKPEIGRQVELVPVEDMSQIGSAVVQRIKELEGPDVGRGPGD